MAPSRGKTSEALLLSSYFLVISLFSHTHSIFAFQLPPLINSESASRSIQRRYATPTGVKNDHSMYPPGVGCVSDPSGRKVIVIGTAHTPSRQQQEEVAILIEDSKPDVVVVELDQERMELLQADVALQRTKGRRAPRYGAELAEAVAAAKRLGVPVLLGDSKKPFTALFDVPSLLQFVDLNRMRRGLRLIFMNHSGYSNQPLLLEELDVARALANDPRKLLPLAASLGIAASAVLAVSHGTQLDSRSIATLHAVEPFLPDLLRGSSEVVRSVGDTVLNLIAFAVVALAMRFIDVLLLARDDVISENALRALEIGAGIKNRRFERYTFRFSKLPEVLAAINAPLFLANCRQNIDGTEVGSWVPFLTLRSPLKENEVRRMNLFEPRWLAMLDGISAMDKGKPGADAESSGLLGSTFGTVHAVNRCYASCPVDSLDPSAKWSSGQANGEQRKRKETAGATATVVEADVVVNPSEARLAVVERVEEGTRPVSGDRRVALWIRGLASLEAPGPEGGTVELRPTAGGFLAARCQVQGASASGDPRAAGNEPVGREGDAASATDGRALVEGDLTAGDGISVVCVVGLVHANPILRRCADRGLRSAAERGETDGEIARAIRERQRAARLENLPWYEYDKELSALRQRRKD